MERLQLQQQWCRALKSRLSYKTATIVVCLFNIITLVLLIQGFFYSSSPKITSSHKGLNFNNLFFPFCLFQIFIGSSLSFQMKTYEFIYASFRGFM